MRRRTTAVGRCAAVFIACLAMGTELRAQASDSVRTGHHGLAGLTRAAVLVTAAALVVAPLDGGIARSMEASSASHPPINAAARTTGAIGGLGAPLLSVGLLTAGALTGHHDMADAGWHAGLSLAIASGLTIGLKTVIGRARPATAPWSDPGERGPDSDEFRPVTTSGAWASFPSGHTTAAFATAASLSAEVRRHDPPAARIVTPLLYTGAGLVGLSRMYNNQHWASDVVAGAVIGILVGHEVVARAHNEHASLAAHLLPSAAGISAHSAAVAWSFSLR
jgi:membrane-associated phospholipid phosphatase